MSPDYSNVSVNPDLLAGAMRDLYSSPSEKATNVNSDFVNNAIEYWGIFGGNLKNDSFSATDTFNSSKSNSWGSDPSNSLSNRLSKLPPLRTSTSFNSIYSNLVYNNNNYNSYANSSYMNSSYTDSTANNMGNVGTTARSYIDISNYNAAKGNKLAALGLSMKKNSTSQNYCLRGVKEILKTAGYKVNLEGLGSAYLAADRLAQSSEFKEIQAPSNLQSLPPGAIVVNDKTAEREHGHIAIVGQNGEDISDRVRSQVIKQAPNVRVFIPV